MPRIKARLAVEPEVGIIYLVKGKLWIDGTPVSKAGDYGEFKIHENDHIRYWDQLMRMGSVPKLSEYEEHPRGRVVYNTKTRQYTLYLDRCILGKKAVVQRIIREMRLPSKQTVTATDSRYRCYHCLVGVHSRTES